MGFISVCFFFFFFNDTATTEIYTLSLHDSLAIAGAPASDGCGPVLAVRDLTVRFGGLAAVQDVSLALERGEILALIGPNGAGKSTAFNVMTGFQPPDAGRVTLGGRDTGRLAPHRIAELGLVRMFQRTSIFP